MVKEAEIRRRMMESDLSKQEVVHLVDKACDDITDALCRLYDKAEV